MEINLLNNVAPCKSVKNKVDDNCISSKKSFKDCLVANKNDIDDKNIDKSRTNDDSNISKDNINRLNQKDNSQGEADEINSKKADDKVTSLEQIEEDDTSEINKNDACDDLNSLMKIIQDLINLLKLRNNEGYFNNISDKIDGVSNKLDLNKDLCNILFYLKNNLNDNSKIDFMKNKLLQIVKIDGNNLVVNSDKISELVSQLNISDKEIYNESNLTELLLNQSGQDIKKYTGKNIDSEKSILQNIKSTLLKLSNDSSKSLKNVNGKTNLASINNDFKNLLNYNVKADLSSDLKNSNNNSSDLNKDFKVLNDILNDNNSDSSSKFTNKINNVMNIMSHMSKANLVDNSEAISKAENLFINKNNFAQDIIKTVTYMTKNNLQNLTVKIVPKELGEIVISMISQDGNMKLAMKASNKDTLNLLNANLKDIVGELNSQNIKIQPAQVTIYNEDASFFSNQFNQQSNQGGHSNSNNTKGNFGILNENADENSDESVKNKIYDSNQINTFA